MGKMNALALDNQSIIENEWEVEQRALLLSQVDEIIQEMINEYNYEMSVDHGDWSVTNEN